MITNTGKSIIVKYLMGQTSTYASHIAMGCGAKPVIEMTYSVDNKLCVNGYVTLHTVSDHSISVGEYITVSNVDLRLNGVHEVVAESPNTISFNIEDGELDISSVAVSPHGSITRNYSTKTELDFEMFRVPVTSRGYVSENGVSKIVLTAELPALERYEITEIGVYPGVSNPVSTVASSGLIFDFSGQEDWQYYNNSFEKALPQVTSVMNPNGANKIDVSEQASETDSKAFRTNSDNATFESELRLNRQERPRMLADTIIVSGNLSDIIKYSSVTSVDDRSGSVGTKLTLTGKHGIVVGDKLTIKTSLGEPISSNVTVSSVSGQIVTLADSSSTESYSVGDVVTLPRLSVNAGSSIHRVGQSIPLKYASPSDELRLAFSIIAKEEVPSEKPALPSSLRMIVEFADSSRVPGENANMSAQAYIDIVPQADNHYVVSKTKITDIYTQGSFSWDLADVSAIYVSAIDQNGLSSDAWMVALDAMRFENVTSVSPVYGLVGYSVVENKDILTQTRPRPFIKLSNAAAFTEFRYSVDVI